MKQTHVKLVCFKKKKKKVIWLSSLLHCGYLLIYSSGSCVTLHHIWLHLQMIQQQLSGPTGMGGGSILWPLIQTEVTYVQLVSHRPEAANWGRSAAFRGADRCGACYETLLQLQTEDGHKHWRHSQVQLHKSVFHRRYSRLQVYTSMRHTS